MDEGHRVSDDELITLSADMRWVRKQLDEVIAELRLNSTRIASLETKQQSACAAKHDALNTRINSMEISNAQTRTTLAMISTVFGIGGSVLITFVQGYLKKAME